MYDEEVGEDAEGATTAIGDELEDWQLADEDEPATDDIWASEKRELLTSVLDYNLNTLSELVVNEQIDLSPRYQRRDRWKPDRQSRLIESFLMNVPVPPIFLNEDDYGKYSVIDGKQRLTAITEFMRGRLKLRGLKVFSELNGQSFDDLSPALRNIASTRANLRATIILRQSNKDVKFEVFRRLNTGGIALNPQEIRNSTWPGPFNNLLLDLSEEPLYRRLLGITRPQSSAIYKEMRDVELVLRFFTFKDDWNSFGGGMAKRLDLYMSTHQRPSKIELTDMRDDFLRTLDVVNAVFGEYAFRRWVPEREHWRKQIVAALFDAQMFAAMSYGAPQLAPHRDEVLRRFRLLFSDKEFRGSIDAATNTPLLFRSRIKSVRALFDDVISGRAE